MTAVDWIIIGFVVLMALWGYGQGLIISGLSLAGFAGGAFAGSRLAPLLLDQGSSSPYAPLFSLVTALFVGGLAAIVFEAVGVGIRRRVAFSRAEVVDGIGGAALVATLGLALVWIMGAVALQTPGARQFRKDIQRSAILQKLNEALPPSGPILNALARVDPFPRISGPEADVPPPNRRILRDPDVKAAHDSVVRVLGVACGLAVQGSGWVAAPGEVVTNAHVVAGEDDTTVTPNGGSELDAEVVHYDTRNDLAILQVSGLSLGALELAASTPKGASAAVIGYPENGPLSISPARLGRTGEVSSQDSYGRGPVTRSMTPFRGEVRHGNSGGPVVDASGEVLTTVFAASQGSKEPEGLGIPNAVVAEALQGRLAPTDSGPCAA
jgi:S1-C subfamily serine protease